MKFFSEGPSIPDALLEDRDRGRVVFFCGAGISLSAGMPTFLELARYVVDGLRVAPHANAAQMLKLHDVASKTPQFGRPSLDRVFNVLQQEYLKDDIDRLIVDHLKPDESASLDNHKTILRLSRSANGKPQIVTTNFDLLFERAAEPDSLDPFVGPNLPNLASDRLLEGLVYLHGRIDTSEERRAGPQGFVVSSSEFGRAYLAEGWATRFVRALLEQYTIVLLGYSAADPPIQYLLEGLHARTGGRRAEIYAFDHGEEDKVRQRWHGRGVKPLPYLATDEEHSVLWKTLNAWAGRADDPKKWMEGIVDLARLGPRKLTAEQRGQVVSVVRTSEGATLFADADPSPPGDWLCVFDANLRYAAVERDLEVTYELLKEFGIDDDSGRPLAPDHLGARPVDKVRDDLSGLMPGEAQNRFLVGLVHVPNRWVAPLSTRLLQISRWIERVAHEPVTIWWASKCQDLHPHLLYLINQRIMRPNDLPDVARQAWRLLIEKFCTAPDNDRSEDFRLHDTSERLLSEGWTSSALRLFARTTQPYLKCLPLTGVQGIRPPGRDWSGVELKDVVRFDVRFPRMYEYEYFKPENIPDDVVPSIYLILRSHLELAAALLKDADSYYLSTVTFYPENEAVRGLAPDRYLLWFRSILDRMIKASPGLVRSDCDLWPAEEPFFFDKLRLYVWAKLGLVDGNEVAERLLAMSDGAFWQSLSRRELLFLLVGRWHDFPNALRNEIERRIAERRPPIDGMNDEDSSRMRSIEAARMLGWLIEKGCFISEETNQRLERLRQADPRWTPDWDDLAAESPFKMVEGMITVDTGSSSLLDLPIDQIIPAARKDTREAFDELKEYKPFDGLVRQRPARAVTALVRANRAGQPPVVGFWQSALNNWPDHATLRLTCYFAHNLSRLPVNVIIDLKSSLFMWLEKNLPTVARYNLKIALEIFDKILSNDVVDKLFAHRASNEKAIESSFGIVVLALNSPAGHAAGCLLSILNDSESEEDTGLPESITSRLERLLTELPEEGRNHATSIITRDIGWLNRLDPSWVTAIVTPLFGPESDVAEAAWSGFAYAPSWPRAELFANLKADFLRAVVHASQRSWDEATIRGLQEKLVRGCLWCPRDPAYVSFEECRTVMRMIDDNGRSHCLRVLRSSSVFGNAEEWLEFGKPFLENAWPKETKYRTEATSHQFAMIAVKSGDLFPEVFEAVLPRIGPVSGPDAILLELNRPDDKGGGELPIRFPKDTLSLLDALVSDQPASTLHMLGVVVNSMGDAEPALRRDPRWRRLDRIASGD